MAELTVRTRVAMLIAFAIVALGLGYFLWPSSAPEPTGRAMFCWRHSAMFLLRGATCEKARGAD
jgi:hypothetical protein